MKFSIIVPIYNSENYLKECLNSLKIQSFKDFEILLIDDGSTDRSASICKEFEDVDIRFRYFFKENGGASSARKFGVLKSNGDYIVCLDSDDFVNEDYLLNIDKLLKDNPDVLCIGYNKDNIDHYNFQKPGMYKSRDIIQHYFVDLERPFYNIGNFIYGIVTKVVRRDIFVECQSAVSDDIVFGEDLILSYIILNKADVVAVANYSGYCYRDNPDSVTHNYNDKMPDRYYRTCEELLKFFEPAKVYWFALTNLLNIYQLMVINSISFKDFMCKLQRVNFCANLFGLAKKASVKTTDFKTKIKIFLFRFKMFRMMYLFYKK